MTSPETSSSSVAHSTAAHSPAPLAGRTALVTGAAGSIGGAIARALAAQGASIIAVDRDAAGLEAITKDLGATSLAVDLSDIANLEAAISEVSGDVDILVNNAGVQHISRLEEFPTDKFEFMLALMLTAPFVLTKAVLPGMYRRRWGRIINISSAHGRVASPFKGAYVTAKHGLEGLSKVIAVEGGEHGVTSNCINPGYVRTPMVDSQIADQARENNISPDKVLADILLAASPVKRLIEPQEVAEAAVFLCGPGSASISGSDLVIDGAWTAH